MPIGWIRAYAQEHKELEQQHGFVLRSHRATYRKCFKTDLWSSESDNATSVRRLAWGTVVELPNGLSRGPWTKVKAGTREGWVDSAHVVEVRYVKQLSKFQAILDTPGGGKQKLLWGDLVQITKAGTSVCDVRVRGHTGKMRVSDLTDEALLEVYFIDVGQGDGVLVRTPDGRHMLVDGGLERTKQVTGKNAADFVDWKFFADYGDFRVRLDSLMASHSDNDHYGGLHDLVRNTDAADRELDCLGTDIKVLHHPGLSRWESRRGAEPAHKHGLGPMKDGAFTRLLDDRADADASVVNNASNELSGPWKYFIRDVLKNSTRTKVERVIVNLADLQSSQTLPKLWPSKSGCDILVLGPVATTVDGVTALPDFKKKSYNTNGHSICLRLDYGNARILLTGDLNKRSMDWLADSYGDAMGAWECDVAKACHHGSDDISFRFLEKIRAAATVISSGDAEGHAHPRPEIVSASTLSGFTSIDRDRDRVITPLVYMTEIERSVSLGALNRIDFRRLPVAGSAIDGAILGRNIDELNDKAFLTPEARSQYSRTTKAEQKKFLADNRRVERPILEALESDLQRGHIGVDFNLTVPQGPVSSKNVRKRAWRSRIMEKNHYGLVNVRTDGKTIMCATLNETEEKWITHSFPARF